MTSTGVAIFLERYAGNWESLCPTRQNSGQLI